MRKRIIAILMCILLCIPFVFMSSSAASDETTYKAALSAKGFPDSYLDALWKLHQAHPKWDFEPLKTGIDFDTAVSSESANGKCTVDVGTSLDMFVSKNESTQKSDGSYTYTYVDGTHVNATDFEISYFMDPRNFLSEVRTMFQFEDLAYPDYMSDSELLTAIESILDGSFMDAVDSVSGKRFAVLLREAGLEYDVNPCYLASTVIQEVGSKGSGSSGTIDGVTYYNYFNIGAYADGGSGANVTNAIKRAKSEGWTTPEKAIDGGAAFVSDGYINKGQSTKYLYKFNVNPNSYYSLYTHQYMSALNDPAQSSNSTYNGYVSSGTLDYARQFLIPVYNNMPTYSSVALNLSDAATTGTTVFNSNTIRSTAAYKVSGETSNKVASVSKGTSLTINGLQRSTTVATQYTSLYVYQLTYGLFYKVIYSGTTRYTDYENLDITKSVAMTVGETKTLGYKLSASASNIVRFDTTDSKIATVNSKTGLVTAVGTGTVKIVAYTAGGSVDYINLVVTKSSTIPSQLTSSKYTINQSSLTVSGIPVGTTANTLVSGITQSGYAKVYSGSSQVTTGRLATGMTLKLVNGSTVIKTYTIAVTGDVNGDGYIKTGDAVMVLRYVSGLESLSGAVALAADANKDGYVKTGDAVTILRTITS